MVGDHPAADTSGGRAAGLKTGWVSRGKEWAREMTAPDLSAGTGAAVIDAVVPYLAPGPPSLPQSVHLPLIAVRTKPNMAALHQKERSPT
jgi:hypothetical protein